MARPEYLNKYCRPRRHTESIEIQATANGQVISCPHRTYRDDRYVHGHYMCGLGGGICEFIRNPVPTNSPVLKPGLLTRARNFLTGNQTEIYIKEVETYYPIGQSLIRPEVKQGWLLATEEPWKSWTKEANELAKHFYEDDWQERINSFKDRPGGPELLAAARKKWDDQRHIILIHPDGT